MDSSFDFRLNSTLDLFDSTAIAGTCPSLRMFQIFLPRIFDRVFFSTGPWACNGLDCLFFYLWPTIDALMHGKQMQQERQPRTGPVGWGPLQRARGRRQRRRRLRAAAGVQRRLSTAQLFQPGGNRRATIRRNLATSPDWLSVGQLPVTDRVPFSDWWPGPARFQSRAAFRCPHTASDH